MNLQKKMYIHLYTIIDWLCENRFLITKLHGKILFRAKHINIVVYPVCGQRENLQIRRFIDDLKISPLILAHNNIYSQATNMIQILSLISMYVNVMLY